MQILVLNDLNRGNALKQGDRTPLRYQIADADGPLPSKVGQTATIYFTQGDDEYYKTTTKVKADNVVEFSIDKVLPVGDYAIHVQVGVQIFPSANIDKFTITQSPLGRDVNVIKILGVDAVVDKVLSGIKVSIPKEVRDQVSVLIKAETDKLKNLQTQAESEFSKLTSHTDDYNNPHRVTKAQVGLGSVLNYGLATQTEAEVGTANDKYMTPLRTKQAINKSKFETTVSSNTKVNTITHNLNTLSPVVSAYMDNQEFLLWTVEVLDLNRIRVDLGSQIPSDKTIRIGVR